MSILLACVSVYYVCAWCPVGEKRAFVPLKLKLLKVVSHHCVLGIEFKSSEGALSAGHNEKLRG